MLHKLLDVLFIKIVPFFFAIVLHEISHGLTAYALGDDTAKKAGRFKLYTHFDLWGSFIIPVFLYFVKSPFLIGYAKPVPIDIRKFKDPIFDMAIVAIAGPLCNILLATASILLLKNYFEIMSDVVQQFCLSFIMCNLCLFFFNLIPIPPLDGSRIIAAVIPERFVEKYYALEQVGFFVVIALEMLTRQISNLIGHNVSLFHIFIEVPAMGILNSMLIS